MDLVSGPALLRIGSFSRASWLSIKALRAYHEAGLLVPAEIDPQTGYRSYSVAQLTDAAIIRGLRQLDLPLDTIRQVLDARADLPVRELYLVGPADADHPDALRTEICWPLRAADATS